jgi:hypothetical protein
MEQLGAKIAHPPEQLGDLLQQPPGSVQLEDPLGEGPEHLAKLLDPSLVVDLVVMVGHAPRLVPSVPVLRRRQM